jgi:hypothetical protein|tara:strand:+ start:344 stop:589 length:246 start_codon:yes stop_codon:yes gene_type:complete
MIKCLILLTGLNLIAKVEEIQAEIGDPNCQISDVCIINSDGTVSPWLNFTEDTELMIRSENILTLVDPNKDTLKLYLETIS